MAEAIAAFSLAANIVQFIDFGLKLSTNIWKIYTSGRDGSDGILDHRKITTDLQEVLESLQQPLGRNGEVFESERGFRELAEQCAAVAIELQSSLKKVSVPENFNKRDALKAAFRKIWKEEEIRALEDRLEAFRSQLTLHLLTSLRDQARQSLDRQTRVLDQMRTVRESAQRLEGMVAQVTENTEGIGVSVLDFLTSRIDFKERTQEKEILQRDLITAIYQDRERTIELETETPSISAARQKQLQSAFIARLRYPGMEDREGRIAQAHEKTFQWIFKDRALQEKKWSSFKGWLESDSPLYWITGKAGSGKSTLMKFICQKDAAEEHNHWNFRCEEYLRKWARDSRLITATFFFWNSGVQMQMSQRGLLLSLLNQILQQCPELIPSVSPNRWEALCLFNDDPREWTDDELREMLCLAGQKLHEDTRLCLFVDGLDEFDGDLGGLIDLFKGLITCRNVRMCVASRPWVEFEDAFKHKPSLMVQDLTYQDIRHYITERLHKDINFMHLCKREPEYAGELIENIASKACGVFLWVHLVVNSLIAGMGHGDRVSDLQKRLNLLPPDLEKLYERIIMSLDPFYKEHASQLFSLVRESLHPPSLLLLYFADEESPEYAINLPIKALSQEKESLITETMRRRVNSRCKGLLEVGGENNGATVQYLHRTVKDYVESAGVQETLRPFMKTPFDPHLRLCAANLAHLKILENAMDQSSVSLSLDPITRCLYSASRIEYAYRGDLISLLDDLDKTYSFLRISYHHSTEFSLSIGGYWSSEYYDFVKICERDYGFPFLSLVVQFGVVEYVKAKASQGCLVQLKKKNESMSESGQTLLQRWPLLLDAICSCNLPQNEYLDKAPCPEMVDCLLKKGADPMYPVPWDRSLSVWGVTLVTIMEQGFDGRSSLRQGFNGLQIKPTWKAILRMMIEHGAVVEKKGLMQRLGLRKAKRILEGKWIREQTFPKKRMDVLQQELEDIMSSTQGAKSREFHQISLLRWRR